MEPNINEPAYIISLQEELVQANNRIKELEAIVLKYGQLDDSNFILETLAGPDTSLYYLNNLYSEISLLAATDKKTCLEATYKYVLSSLDKAIKALIQLDFSTALNIALALIEPIFISCTLMDDNLGTLDKAIIRLAYNAALEQYIFEFNATAI